MDSKLLFSSASYAWGPHSICRLHRIPFAPNVVLQQIAPPYAPQSFQRAAQAIGLKSALHQCAWIVTAIARALLKRPRILIFDEATSSLDAPTAEQFAKTVNRL